MEAVDGNVRARPPSRSGQQAQPGSNTKVRTEFPETWLWSESLAG